eukprot:COSAG01_NODE_3750_length_5733_cov_22.729322_3_plen_366_part_00
MKAPQDPLSTHSGVCDGSERYAVAAPPPCVHSNAINLRIPKNRGRSSFGSFDRLDKRISQGTPGDISGVPCEDELASIAQAEQVAARADFRLEDPELIKSLEGDSLPQWVQHKPWTLRHGLNPERLCKPGGANLQTGLNADAINEERPAVEEGDDENEFEESGKDDGVESDEVDVGKASAAANRRQVHKDTFGEAHDDKSAMVRVVVRDKVRRLAASRAKVHIDSQPIERQCVPGNDAAAVEVPCMLPHGVTTDPDGDSRRTGLFYRDDDGEYRIGALVSAAPTSLTSYFTHLYSQHASPPNISRLICLKTAWTKSALTATNRCPMPYKAIEAVLALSARRHAHSTLPPRRLPAPGCSREPRICL